MKSRLEMALALLIVLVAAGMILTTPGCATLAEQDQQRRELINHENRIRALEAER